MTKAKKSTRIVLAASIVVVGVVLSLAIPHSPAGQVGQAVPAVQDVRSSPTPSPSSQKPAVAETAPRETWQPADSTATFADGTPLPHKTFDQRKAELDLKEAELKLKAADTDFKRFEALRGQGYSVPNSEIEHAELAANLARLQFGRAQLQFEQAMNIRSTAYARLAIEGINNATWSSVYALPEAQGMQWGISIRSLLTRTGISLEAPWRVTFLSRTSGKMIDAELLPDLVSRAQHAADGEAPLDTQVHWGDVIRLQFDANNTIPVYVQLPRSRQNSFVGEPESIRLSLKADTTLRQLLGQCTANLKQADIDPDNLEDAYNITVSRVGISGRASFTAILKQFLGSTLPGPVLQPDDHIVVRDARRRNPPPATRPAAPKP